MTKSATAWTAAPLATVRPTRLIMMLPPPASRAYRRCRRAVRPTRASDAATCEGQGSFFLEAQRLRSAHTPVGERTPVQVHAIAEASGAALDQGFQQRVLGQLFHHRAGGYVWFVGRSALFPYRTPFRHNPELL